MRGTITPCGLPAADVVLADGRRLAYRGSCPDERFAAALAEAIGRATTSAMSGGYWEGPKRLRVIATLDSGPHGRLLHVSVSYPQHLPSWRDMRTIRDAFYPSDIDVMMMMPRAEDYVNVHPNCLHMQQTPVGWGIR